MQYPVWYLPEIGGGALIALIAVFHVFISHFAVGGGLYLVMAEKKGLREHSDAILEFTRRHARFFLLVTMVLGSISGVGVWFIIALVNPAATSLLIHNFVFGWAAEWVFFLVEIGAAFVYYYMFGRMDSSTHLKVGYLYFFAAWMSLLLINGIIGVMLTPGGWAESGSFWQGFFNPSFLPSLAFRTCMAVLMAGCYGYLTASWSENHEVRVSMTRFSGIWSLAALIGAIPSALWYMAVLPVSAQQLVQGKSPTIALALQYGAVAVVLLLAITLVAGIIRPNLNNRLVAALAMACAFITLGSFEWTREAARRPYVINEVMYSNSILKDEVAGLNSDGFLRSALWVATHEVTAENRMAAGRDLYIQQCYSCHTLGGANNDLVSRTADMSYQALTGYIGRIHEIRSFMPPFVGTKAEAGALAAYIAGELHGKDTAVAVPAAGDSQAAGRALFEAHCSACHAVEEVAGQFAGKDGAAVGEILLKLNEISDEMQPFSGTEAERSLLSGYLLSPGGEAPAATEADGPAVFDKHCSSCHGVDDLTERTRAWDRQLIYTNLGRLPELVEAMPPFTGSEQERQTLADYLDSLTPHKGV